MIRIYWMGKKMQWLGSLIKLMAIGILLKEMEILLVVELIVLIWISLEIMQ